MSEYYLEKTEKGWKKVEILLGTSFLHLGQLFHNYTRTTYERGENGPQQREFELGCVGFTVTLPSKLSKANEKKKEVREKYTPLNYLFLQYDAIEHENGKAIIKIKRNIIPLVGDYNATLKFLIDGVGSISSSLPEIPISQDFILEFMNGEMRRVEPRELYLRIIEKIRQYIDLDDEYIKIVALWSIGTYFYQLFESYPFLFFYSIWQSGKTKMLTLLSQLCFLGLLDIDISQSSFFRTAEDFGFTLLLDETEYLTEGEAAKQLKKLIYARYKKSGGYVQRVEGDKKKYVKNFRVYGPLAIASVKDVDVLIADRCIRIPMKRGKDPEKMNLWPSKDDKEFQNIRDDLYRLMLQEWRNIKQIYDGLIHGWLSGREWELWRPLATIAKLVGEDITKISEKLSRKKTEAMKMTRLELSIIQALVNIVQKDDYYTNREIREEILRGIIDEEDKAEIKKMLTAKKLGAIIDSLSLNTERKKTNKGYAYYLSAEEVRDLGERWGIHPETGSEKLEVVVHGENIDGDEYGVCELCGKTTFITKIGKYYVCAECEREHNL